MIFYRDCTKENGLILIDAENDEFQQWVQYPFNTKTKTENIELSNLVRSVIGLVSVSNG